jgi:hypothetical protein
MPHRENIMIRTLHQELRQSLPAWSVAVLLPAPAVITSRNGGLGLVYFFVACIGLVAAIFWRDLPERPDEQSGHGNIWMTKLTAAALALLAAWAVFAATCLPLDRSDFLVCSSLAFLALIPALGVTPWMVAKTQNPFVASVFALTLVACMKLLACIVVVFVYGWDASERGYTAMPWTPPNLLVWTFLLFTALLSAIGFRLGAARYQGATAVHDEPCGAQS